MIQPETRYAKVGDDRVAYQVLGEGPRDLVFSLGQWGHVDLSWAHPAHSRFLRRLASFSRLILFDSRGTGLSDPRPLDGREVWEEHWAEDLIAVMAAVRSTAVAILCQVDAGAQVLRFAAAHPERCTGLVLVNCWARLMRAPDYPDGMTPEEVTKYLSFANKYWATERWAVTLNPSLANDEGARRQFCQLFRSYSSPRDVAEKLKMQVSLDVRDVLRSIRAPTLVMHRRNQRMIPIPRGRYLADHIPGARFIELPGADQSLIWETPDLILDHIEEFVTGARHGGEPDRVLATVLFTDMVGSTERAAELGDAAWRALLDRHDQVLREQVGLLRGKVADHAGDGALSTFDSPTRAVECATALKRALAAIGVEIRAGLHTGEIEQREDGRVGGMAVHIGARVLSIAKTGEVLASRTVHDVLIGSRYKFGDRGVHPLKGVPGKWRLFALEN